MMSDFETFLEQQQKQSTATPPTNSTSAPAPTPGRFDNSAPAPAAANSSAQDPFESFLRQATTKPDPQQQAQAVVMSNTGVNAEEAGRAVQVGKQIGLPAAAVETDLPHYEAQAKAQANSQIVASNPVLAKWIAANPDAARTASDDFQNLDGIAKAAQAGPQMTAWSEPDQGATYRERLSDWWRGLFGAPSVADSRRGQSEAEANAILSGRQPGMTDDQAWESSRQAIGGMSQIPLLAAERFADSASFGLAAPVNPTQSHSWQGSVSAGLGQLGGFLLGPAKTAGGLINPIERAAGESFLKATSKDVINQAGTLALASALEKSGHSVLDTHSPEEAGRMIGDALQGGAISGAIFGAAGHILPDNTIMQTALRALGVNVASDITQGTSPFDDRPLEDKIFSYALNTAFSLHGAGRAEGGWLKDATEAKVAEQDFSQLSAMSQLSTESKLRQRDPDAFQKYIDTVTEDGHLSNVYVDGNVFMQEMRRAGITDPELQSKMPDVASQLDEAIKTGGTVSIPTSDYMRYVAGTPLDEQLLQHLRTDPEGKTYAEAQQFFQGQAEQLKEAATKAAAEVSEESAFQQSHDQVVKQIKAQLDEVGRFPSDVNKTNARLQAAIISRVAAKEGVTPEEAWAKYGTQVMGDERAGASFNQPKTGDLSWEHGQRQGLFSHPDVPITRLSGKELGEDREAIKASATEKLKALGKDGLQNDDTGWNLTISAQNRGKLIKWDGNSDASLQALGGIESLVKHAVLAESHPDDKNKNDDVQGVHRLYAPVEIDGVMHRAKLTVRDYTGPRSGDSTKLHALQAMEIEGAQTSSPNTEDEPLGTGKVMPPERSMTISDLLAGSKREDGTGWDQLSQGSRGGYSPSTRDISLLKDADLSTYLHETGHWALDTYAKIAAHPDAPPEVKADMEALLKWFGVKDLDTWSKMSIDEQRPYHEQFAEGFEKYLMEGKSPNIELQPLFSRIRSWLVSVYQSLSNMHVELSDEVRSVFDRMIASEESIKAAEASRVFEPLFADKPEGMSDTDWANYKALGQESTDQAINDMQARSMRDMKWLSNAKSKAMKALQREAKTERDKIRDEVSKQIAQDPIEQTRRWLTKGETTDAQGNEIKAEKGFKFNIDDIKAMYPEGALGNPDLEKLRGMTGKDGLHPDLVAEMFGFRSGDQLVRELANDPGTKAKIDALTDQRMLQEHGELTDPVSVERAAEASIHNEARAKFMATGLKVLTNSPIPAKRLAEGAKEAAEAAIAQKKIGELNYRQYATAETRNNKEALKLAASDPAGAAQAQRSALLNNRLVRAAMDAQDDVRRILSYVNRFNKESILKKMEPDIRDQVQDLLDRFDFRKNPTTGPTRQQQNLMMWAESQKALGYTPNIAPDMLNPAVRMHYTEMTVEQMRGLMDTIRTLEHIGQERKMVTIDGKRMAVQDAVTQMVEKMVARGEKFTDAQLAEPSRSGVDPLFRVTLDRAGSTLRAGRAEVEPMHFKANRFDIHEIMGPFHRLIFEPIFDANYHFLDMTRDVSNKFRDAAKDLGVEWQKSLNNVVENHNLMDNALEVPEKRRLTQGDLIGIALHVGNESNFDKLVNGMKWRPEDVWKALHDNMREKDWQAARILGEAAGAHWDQMDAMNRRLGNTSPDRIEPRPFPTKFGEMPGWYAAVRYDPLRSRLGRKKEDAAHVNPADGLFSRDYYRADTTTNGSLNARMSGYHDFIDLDWHTVEKAIHDTLRDLAYREALIDAHKLYTNSDFRRQFQRTYGPEEYKSMGQWMGRLVNSEVGDEKQSRFTAILAGARRAMVANGIAFRISTMEKHGGSAGLKSAGYFAGGGEKYLLARAKAMMIDHGNQVIEGLAKSRELRARHQQQDRDFSESAASLMEPESLHGKAERFGHAGVAYLDFFTAVPTFHAAYDWAVTEGIPKRLGGTGEPMSEADAAKWADSIVREAHGTNIESGRSMLISNKSEIIKGLTILHGFMNNSFGQQTDMFDKALHANGFGKPELVARYMMAQIAPAILAGYITFGPKVDNEPWWKWLAGVIGGEFAGGLPMLREAYSAIAEGHSDAGLPPWMRAITDIAKAAKSVAKGAEGEPVKHPIKDVGNAAGLFLPGLGQASSTAQFLYDVHTGKQQPVTVGEWLRGISTGKAHQ